MLTDYSRRGIIKEWEINQTRKQYVSPTFYRISHLNLILARRQSFLSLSPRKMSYFIYIQVHFRLDFIKEAKTMNPEQSDLDPCCLQYKLLKSILADERADDISRDWREKGQSLY